MNKSVLTLMLTTVMLMSSPGSVSAEGAVSTASGIVKEFHATELALITEAGVAKPPAGPADLAAHIATLSEVRDEAIAELKSIGISEAPGQRRAGRVYGLIDSYTGGRIESIRRLQAGLRSPERERLDPVILKLISLREAGLKELDESLKSEAREEGVRKPVPVMDQSPYEGTESDGQGMWYR
jgi:hypothetical protein